MGRPKTVKPAEDIGEKVTNHDLLKQDMAQIDAHTDNMRLVDDQYGDNLPYQRDRIENEARFYMAQSAEALLEVGKRLILLKEHEAHGDFENCIKRLGLGLSTARKMMQATIKFGEGKRSALSVLGKTKMFELMTESDDDLDDLAEGGTLNGITKDEFSGMTSREMRAALREGKQKQKQEAETHERMLEEKDKKINELDRQLQRREQRPEDELWTELGQALVKEEMQILGNCLTLERAVQHIYEQELDAPEHLRAACYNAITACRSRLQDIALGWNLQPSIDDLDDDEELGEDGRPVWMSEVDRETKNG